MSDTPLITEKANYNARAGQTIAGNLARGGDGKFTAAGNATASSKKPPQNYGGKRAAANNKLQQRLAARRAAAASKKGGKGKRAAKPKAAARPKSGAAAARQAEAAKRRQVRAAEAAKRKAERDAAKLQRDVARKVAATGRDAAKLQRAQDRANSKAAWLARLAGRRIEAQAKAAARAKAGGGGKGAKPKAAPADKGAALAANRAKVQAATLDGAAFSALQDMTEGSAPAAGEALSVLVKSGLVERDTNGGYRVSQAGRSYTNAAERGDIGRAKDAMSRAVDRAARLEALRNRRNDPAVRGARQATKERAATAEPTSVMVYKQANGVYRWLGVSSTAYQDRDKQYVSLKALQDDVERADLDGNYGPLRFWHMPGVDLGTTDYNAVIGRSLVESGEISDPHIGHALSTSKEHWQMSLGFLHPRDQPRGDTFTMIRRFERSILPASAASNPFTSLLVYNKGNTMASLDEKLAKLKELAGDPDILAAMLAGVDQTEKAAAAAGATYKEAGADGAAADAETKAAGDMAAEDAAAEEDAGAADSILEAADLAAIADAVAAKLAPMLEAMAGATMKQAAVAAVPGNMDTVLKAFAAEVVQTKAAAAAATTTAQAASAKADKAATDASEIATLKQRLAELEGDQPRGVAGGYRASADDATATTKAHTKPAEDAMITAADWLIGPA